MAQMLQETFQDQLVSHPCKDNETELPSPEELKYKILVKCKAISGKDDHNMLETLLRRSSTTPSGGGEEGEDQILQKFSCMQTRKRGILFCKNPRNGNWQPYKCILTDEKLLFVKLKENLRKISNCSSTLSLRTYPSTLTLQIPSLPSPSSQQHPSSPTYSVGGIRSKRHRINLSAKRVTRQNSFTEEWAPAYFADFELISSRFSGSIPDVSGQFCMDLEFSVNCAEIERNTGHAELPHLVRIENGQTLIYSATGKIEEANEWKQAINQVTKARPRQADIDNGNGRRHKISEDLAKLAVYARTTKYRIMPSGTDRAKKRTFNEMHSFPEKIAVKTMTSNASQFIMYHQVQFSRVYPTSTRLYSSNYDPNPLWNAGCQMVALNYQTPGKIKYNY